MFKIKFFMIIIFLLISTLTADWLKEKKKIDYLLSEVSKLEGKFVRNGSEHEASEAVKHLRMKLENAQDSWFAPDKEEWTAVMFIEKVASKSSLSGKKYLIKFKPDSLVETEIWLKQKLKEFK